jgi:hypothetical protein
MDTVKFYFAHLGNIVSQFLNVALLAGHSNESISGRAYRENWTVLMKIINGLFFWQANHCRGAHAKDVQWALEFAQWTRDRVEGSR